MSSLYHSNNKIIDNSTLLQLVNSAVQSAGMAVKKLYSPATRPQDRADINRMIASNDAISLVVLKASLSAALPNAQWAEDEADTGSLPPGEWWVTDPVEGAINHVHGLPDWCITATLVRDNEIILTAVYLPMSDETYAALRGEGAWLNGVRLRTSNKTLLENAIAGTGQAMPHEGHKVYQSIGMSVIAMLEAALVVRVSVPATLQLIQVAAGRQDVFWQFSQVRSGLLAGALMVSEAGGKVTDLQGGPWHLGSKDFLASSPAISAPAVAVLSLLSE